MKKTLITIATTLSAILIVSTATYAVGTLMPSGTAGDDTQYSLNDIYDKLTNFSDTPTATSSPFALPGSVSASFRTLSEIYGLLEAEEGDLVAANIKDGVTMFGVTGNYTASPATLEWSTDQGSMNWAAASTACAGTVDGSTGWRLPAIDELVQGIAYDWITEGDDAGDRFAFSTHYWSSTENLDNTSKAYYALWGGYVDNYHHLKTDSTKRAICVR